ncbi:MAG: DUF1887 family CARF protein [Syntrophorhabdaceae bacterium]|nr:DUF1887 family CARF protein [Syntrophorhabdaceae bacterium]MDD4197225.1 DUF1887 family CARF protein [Syntrophorhabdaceae bacterium]
MASIHVCMVSGQPIPNLIPLKIAGLRPDKVINLVSPGMQTRAERLRKIANEWGVVVEERPIVPYDLQAARDTCLGVLADYESDDVLLNVTGGTKLMALAAFEVFREEKKRIIYVDTEDERIQVLSPGQATIPFESVIKVRSYLAAYGQTITSHRTNPGKAQGNRQITRAFIQNIGEYSWAISILNGYAAPHRKTRTFPLQVAVDERPREVPELREILFLLEEKEVIGFQDDKIVFPDLATVEFLSGGWLEEYVFDAASSIPHSDVKMGVTVEWAHGGSRPTVNEYDVIFTYNNRLYLIECKTRRFSGADREDINSDIIYKLESLRDAAGGLYGKGMLVSYQKLTDAQKKRLAVNGLEYCDRNDLKNLKVKLAGWTRPKT